MEATMNFHAKILMGHLLCILFQPNKLHVVVHLISTVMKCSYFGQDNSFAIVKELILCGIDT